MNGIEESNRLIDKQFLQRFCARDVTLWAEKDAEKEEIAHRLDWLDAIDSEENTIQTAEVLLDGLISEGYSHTVVLGMGGSSLAPEVFSKLFQKPELLRTKGLDLSILDSTNPEQVEEKRKDLPIDKTLFIVSSKSGGTSEVNALEAYFWNELERSGIEKPGSHFIAITDPGTSLEKKGKEKRIQADHPGEPQRWRQVFSFDRIWFGSRSFNGDRLSKVAEPGQENGT